MATYFEDYFTDSDGTALESHTPVVGGAYSRSGPSTEGLKIYNNRLHVENTGSYSTVNRRYTIVPDSGLRSDGTFPADVVVDFGGIARALNSGIYHLQLEFRKQTSTACYRLEISQNSGESPSLLLYLDKVDSGGSATSLDTASLSPITNNVGIATVLTVSGSSISVTYDGSEVIAATDSTITDAGTMAFVAGGGFSDPPTYGMWIDQLVITDLASSAPAIGSLVNPGLIRPFTHPRLVR